MEKEGKMKIEEVLKGVHNVNFQGNRQLGKTFVRFQEHYENPFFRGKIFTLDQLKDWWIHNHPDGIKKGKFTYYDFWESYNVPSHIFEPFYNGRFDPLSGEEIRLLNAFEDKRGKPFYVIGTYGSNSANLRHEMAHGLAYTNPEYQRQVLEVVRGIPSEDRAKLDKFLVDTCGGYHPSVMEDEAHAYLLDRRCLGRNNVSSVGLRIASDKIKRIFRKFCK